MSEPFGHPALFYRDDDTYLAGTIPFIADGLAAGEPVAVAVPRRRLDLLTSALGDRAEKTSLIDMAEAGRNPGRIIPRVLRAFADAHPGARVRIIGEPVWPGRSQAEYPACVQHEALINHAFTGRPITILCPYDTARLDERVLADAHATHPVIIEDAIERPSTAYDPDRTAAACNQPLPRPPQGASAFAFDGRALPEVRTFAWRRAAALGLPTARLDDLALAVAELTTNSVLHGGGTGTLRIWAEGDQVVCEVRDRGHLTDPLAGRHLPPPGRPGGRGLLLVNCLSDLVRTHTGVSGTTIRFYLDRAVRVSGRPEGDSVPLPQASG
ncbi:sensor histidine kinase [Streptomyces fulvorobeus]|uniref:Anti-sigma regulatory factor n=1 Tax=Streptomyces fulvorobeus TaxID=284028 RepID=A0A7J0C310_9ACTN|nr:sensor histidine kinase [Streptomyces fulvorobeus]NYE40611.1 anti-sigma regulatory factor (Ser/Thr protein kinase) [Streptomyces fulvorobeus]GFM96905.1 anti-sigma regulatory factor [Streptomyces fulvorobeus]